MYKIASKMTRDKLALVSGTNLACNLCVVYYALDIHFSNVDLVLVGKNQRKFISQKVGLNPVAALILPEIPGTNGERMSSTVSDFYLEPFDTSKQIGQKIAKSFCEAGNLDNNVALKLAKLIVFEMLKTEEEILIERSEENGGNLRIKNFEELQKHFKTQSLHPNDLKPMVTLQINRLFDPIRKNLKDQQTKLLQSAFPVNKGAKKK